MRARVPDHGRRSASRQAYDGFTGKCCSQDSLKFRLARGGQIQMGSLPGFLEVKVSVEEAIDLLRRAVAALEMLAAEQKRANDLYAEVNQVALAPARNMTELQP